MKITARSHTTHDLLQEFDETAQLGTLAIFTYAGIGDRSRMGRDIADVIQRIASVIAERTRLQLPASPEVLAVCLGIVLEPRPPSVDVEPKP